MHKMSRSTCSIGLRWPWLAVVAIILDLVSKSFIVGNLQFGESVPLFPYLNLFYVQNYGAAFSFLADKGGWQRWLLALNALVVIIALIVLIYRGSVKQKLKNIAFTVIIGGALGNLFDRIYYGFVIDFIDFHVGKWHFATFNLADIFICVGVALLVLEIFLTKSEDIKKS